MSMQTMQMVLCRASVDRTFQAALLSTPDEALQQYDLDDAEAGILRNGSFRSLADLAAATEAWRRGEPQCFEQHELAMAS